MLTIPLPELNQSGINPLYSGNIKRLATATGVKIIDSNYFLVTNSVGQRMYLFYFNLPTKEYNIVDQIDTTYNNKKVASELIDYNEKDLVAISNFTSGSQTLYKLKNYKLSHFKDLPKYMTRNKGSHGIGFVPKTHILGSTYLSPCEISFMDYEKNANIYHINFEPFYAPKDIFFIDENHMLVIYTTGKILNYSKENSYTSKVVYYEIDLIKKTHKIIDIFQIPGDSHTDSIVFHQGVIFVGNQRQNTVEVMLLDDNKISYLTSIEGFNLPHAVDIEPINNLLLVTNYGDNSVSIIEIPDAIKKNMYHKSH